MQTPKIEQVSKKVLVGHSVEMSLQENKTFELFSGFMPKRKQIVNAISEDIYEVMLYNNTHFKAFSPKNTFTKWATLEVSNTDKIPNHINTLVIDEGLYAVFLYKGLPKDFGRLMRYILSEWLPQSNYQLDHRPHFNVLGEAYKRNHPDSEEKVYIPIKI
ncbi:GyrI-like domain-containing protein [Ichthyenterobacterium sp. W332]|uniref:GyrI-like domain-containing protein n=1 Tax=Microcosmobacter mediterraneus TaxID=3075607 RepID=A0ABU2YKF5_9FLAO|nr:GyrI-like domain-containing protein [Ichthyenterobacterium sp. W332]MDT0557503.1 GyrI-like domain-containing protein [Ichthyenterobacterium sp. W332]